MRTPTAAWLCVALLSSSAHAIDLTSFANLFIGTASGANGGSGGNAFPGAAVPHAMVKVRVASQSFLRLALSYRE